MELLFNGKRSQDDVVADIKEYNNETNFDFGKSFLFCGNNFVGMSELLNKYKGFVDLVYIDPPFNTNQVFSIGEGRTSTVSRKKEGKIAYSDLMDTDDFLRMMYERFILIKIGRASCRERV